MYSAVTLATDHETRMFNWTKCYIIKGCSDLHMYTVSSDPAFQCLFGGFLAAHRLKWVAEKIHNNVGVGGSKSSFGLAYKIPLGDPF